MTTIKRITASILCAVLVSVSTPVSIPIFQNIKYVEAATVKLNKTKGSIYVGETLQLEVLNTTKSVKWSSSDQEIGKVSSKGKVTGLKPGTVSITAKVGTKQYTSVVEIKAKELTAKEVYQLSSKATVEITAEVSSTYINIGSGFFIDNGIVVTNYHVIAGAYDIKISTYDDKVYQVQQVLGYDKNIDIAILQVDSENEYLMKNQQGVTVGEDIYVLGSPLGLTGTFTNGMVASASRRIDDIDYIQVTAPMSPGNSGGPLINTYGEVMGINTWQYADGQNLNFSINISELDKIDTSRPVEVTEFSYLTAGNIAYNSSGNISDINWYNSYVDGNVLTNQNLNSLISGYYNYEDYGYQAIVLLVPTYDLTSTNSSNKIIQIVYQ
jgi:S1-C subfamily serine protease